MEHPTYTLIQAEEGVRDTSYIDSKGHLTIGIGFNMDQSGAEDLWEEADVSIPYGKARDGAKISELDIYKLFDLTTDIVKKQAPEVVKNYTDLSANRKAVIESLIFQMGLSGAKKFKRFRKAVESYDFAEAAKELLDSKFAREDAPSRAKRAAKMMEEDLSISAAEDLLVSNGVLSAKNRVV